MNKFYLTVGVLFGLGSIPVLSSPGDLGTRGPSAAIAPVSPANPNAIPLETGCQLSPAEAGQLLGYHNELRAKVGVQPLRWSPELAQAAQKWADKIAQSGQYDCDPNSPYAQNLSIHRGALEAAKDWQSESAHYVAGTAISATPGKFETGHYTQMVWYKTDELGAGVAVIKKGPKKGLKVVICNYNPPGNYTGQKPY